MTELVHLGVRTVHLVAMAALVGGTAATWAALRADLADPVALATGYEWLFWAAAGLLVLTGVGNLGALGPPGPGTAWGRTLTDKLSLVAVLLAASIVRTLAVARLSPGDRGRGAARRFARRACAATGWTLVAVVVLAEVLAHG